MDIGEIRNHIAKGRFFITDHAFIEAFKDGITFDEIVWALNHGQIIEDYPQRDRCLIYARLQSGIYLHVTVDYLSRIEIEIVTVYIPDSKLWIKGRKRKR